MPLVLRGGQSVALSREVFSWDANMQVLGSAPNYASYIATSTGTVVDDADFIFNTQRSVRTVIRFLARNIAQVALHSFKMAASGDRERVRNTPVASVLKQPNPYHTPFSFFFELVVDYCKHERYLAEIFRGPGPNDYQLVPVPAHLWKFKRNSLRQPEFIKFNDGTIEHTTSGRYLWLDRYPDDIDGMAGLIMLLREEHSGAKYRESLWAKGARVSGFVERPSTAPDWSKAAKAAFMRELARAESGGDQEGGTALLEDDMRYRRGETISPQDGQQLEARKLSEAIVAAAFGIPPMFVGLMDNANYSNTLAFREALYGDTLGPWFVEIAQAFNNRFVKVLGTKGEFVEFNVHQKLQMSFKDQSDIIGRNVGTPIMTINEGRRMLNLPSQGPEYDKIIIPSYIKEDKGDKGDKGDGGSPQ